MTNEPNSEQTPVALRLDFEKKPPGRGKRQPTAEFLADKPDPEKVWELTVHLMAGQRIEPAQALRLVIEARDLAIEYTRAVSRSRFPRPALPRMAQTLWKEITGKEDMGEGWNKFPNIVEKWCRKHHLRDELVLEVRGHVERIIAARPKRGLEFPDTPIMRFVLDLMIAEHGGEPLCLGDHLRFFDLTPYKERQISTLTFRGTPLKLDKPLP